MPVQDLAWLLALLLMATICALFGFVYLRSRPRNPDYPPLQARAYRLRTRLFWAMALTMVPAALFLLGRMPYPTSDAKADQVVEVLARQWSWELSADRFRRGETVLFRVRSADVNHGFGLYDDKLRLLAQTQAMPGVTNVLRHTFTRTGSYKVLCMEYCGTAHHAMLGEIEVVD